MGLRVVSSFRVLEKADEETGLIEESAMNDYLNTTYINLIRLFNPPRLTHAGVKVSLAGCLPVELRQCAGSSRR